MHTLKYSDSVTPTVPEPKPTLLSRVAPQQSFFFLDLYVLQNLTVRKLGTAEAILAAGLLNLSSAVYLKEGNLKENLALSVIRSGSWIFIDIMD